MHSPTSASVSDASAAFFVGKLRRPGLTNDPLVRATHRLLLILLVLRLQLLDQGGDLLHRQLVLLIGFDLEVLVGEVKDLGEDSNRVAAAGALVGGWAAACARAA